jgi:drug/metabolite transporter (DMT)-like permease
VAWLFAIGAALAWSVLDALRKRLAGDVAPVASAALLSLGPAPAFGIWAAVDGSWFASASYVAPAAASVAINALAYAGFMASVRAGMLSTTIPLLALTPVFATALAWIHLGETPSSLQLLGIGLVVAGALALHAETGIGGWLRGIAKSAGARFMVGTAALWAMASVADKSAIQHAAVPAHAFVQTTGVGLLLCGWLAATKRTASLRIPRRAAGTYATALVVTGAALGCQLAAYAAMEIALVETLKRAVGVTFAVVLGRVAFDEELTVRKGASVLAIAAGTVIASLWR